MSKRGPGADFTGDEERYPGNYPKLAWRKSETHKDDPPVMASAAQMAKRKIASTRKGSSRAASPAAFGAGFGANADFTFEAPKSIFAPSEPPERKRNNNMTDPSMDPTPVKASANGFWQSTFTSFGGSGMPATPMQRAQNGASSTIGQSALPSFGSSMPATNMQHNTFASFGSTQPSQQSNDTSFGGFGQNNMTPTTTSGSTFGSFGQPQAPEDPDSPMSDGDDPQENNVPGGFGANQQNATATQSFNGFRDVCVPGPKVPMTDAPNPDFEPPQPHPIPAPASQSQFPSNNHPNTAFGGSAQTTQQGISYNPWAAPGQQPQVSQQKNTSFFTSGGQNTQQANNMPNTTFAGLGQGSQENGETPGNAFRGIGRKLSDDAPNSSNPFTRSQNPLPAQNGPLNGQKTMPEANTSTASIFNVGSSQTPSQPQQQAPKPAASNVFGANAKSQSDQLNGTGKGLGLFGSDLTHVKAPQGNASVFNTAPEKDSSSGSKFVFSSSDPSQIYRPQSNHDDDDDGEESTRDNTYGRVVEQAPTEQAPAEQPKIGMFGSSFSQPKTPQSNTSAIPPKSMFMTNPTSVSDTPNVNATSEDSAPAKPRSLFERMDPAGQAKVMAASQAKLPQTQFDKAPETPATIKPSSLFSSQTTSTTPAAPPTLQATQSSSESQNPKAQQASQKPTPEPSTFGLFTPKPTQPAAPSTAFKAPAAAPTTQTDAPSSQSTKASGPLTAADGLTAQQQERLKGLNQALIAHLQNQAYDQDWSPIFQFYNEIVAKICGVTPTSTNKAAASVSQPVASDPKAGSGSLFSSSATGTTAPQASQKSFNMFAESSKTATSSASIAQTPNQPKIGNLFKAPATAPPAVKKRPFEEDEEEKPQSPGSEKRTQPSEPTGHPQQPEAGNLFKPQTTAPSAVKKAPFGPFVEDDEEPTQSSNAEKHVKSNEPQSYPKVPETSSSSAKLFASSLDKSKSSASPQTLNLGKFNPSAKSMFSTSDDKTPSTSTSSPAFKLPAFAPPASGNSFLSAFGQKAQVGQEEARMKRKANDYDSDEETTEQWEKRDREEQEAKRVKIMEAGQSSGGFKFSTAKPVTAKEVEKAQGPGDNTWKPETPIKFSASNADASTTPAAQPPKLGMLGKPASLSTSRATTPGVTTDGENSNTGDGAKPDGEPSDEQKDAQIDANDMTALMPVERDENEVLMELNNVKSKKFVPVEDKGKSTWVSKGDGRAYLLKNKASGKMRILQKVGLNQLALNFEAVKGAKYELHPKKNTMVVAPFMDHLYCVPAKLDRFFITTETAEEAKELARMLNEDSSQ